MNVKAALAALLPLALPTPSHALPPDVIVGRQSHKQVICPTGKGSAFGIDFYRFITAAHVAVNEGCKIDGRPMRVVYQDPTFDFAIVETDKRHNSYSPYSCEGFKPGQAYLAIGYADGLPVKRSMFVWPDKATMKVSGNPVALRGDGEHFIRGMSGGGIFDQEGRAVGLVSGELFGFSFAFSLSSTALCTAAFS